MKFVLYCPVKNAFVFGFYAPPLNVSYTIAEHDAMVFDSVQDAEHAAAFIKNVVVRFKGMDTRGIVLETPSPEARWCSLAARARRPELARIHSMTKAEMISEFLRRKGKAL